MTFCVVWDRWRIESPPHARQQIYIYISMNICLLVLFVFCFLPRASFSPTVRFNAVRFAAVSLCRRFALPSVLPVSMLPPPSCAGCTV